VSSFSFLFGIAPALSATNHWSTAAMSCCMPRSNRLRIHSTNAIAGPPLPCGHALLPAIWARLNAKFFGFWLL